MPAGSILFTALLALSSANGPADLPNRTQVQAALNLLENCRGATLADCPSSQRVYRVHEVRCRAIAPEEQRPAVACRIDLSLDHPNTEQNTRHRDECIRFARRDEAGGAASWTSLQIRDRPCEVASILTRDPHPLPDRAQLERALVAMHTCHDLDGITDCFNQPTGARVDGANCEGASPSEEGRRRVLCRLSARVDYGRFGRPQRLSNVCVAIERFSNVDESPPYWGGMEIVGEALCDRR